MQSDFYYLECVVCHKKTSEDKTVSVCLSCGGPLDVKYDYAFLKEQVNEYVLKNTPPKTVKYLDFYPFGHRQQLATLGEGGTALHHAKNFGSKIGLPRLFVKNEGVNPTGAFKDRGSFVEINKAKELGYKTVCVASTGNMAASVAAYSAQANLECFVFVPDNTPRGKLAQAISYGAHVIQVRGTYSDAYKLAMEVAQKYNYYLAGDYVFRAEGQKSLAFEVCEQLWSEAPDWVVVPIGMGTNFAAIWKGFREYYEFGIIKSLPRMIAVQAQGAAPIVRAWKEGSKIIPVGKPATVCGAIAVGNPLDAPKVFAALKESNGLAISVPDDETLEAQQQLARSEALYVEPSSATTIAALGQLIRDGVIHKNDTVVCVATGAGLKDPATTLKIIAEPPTIEPLLSEAMNIIESGVLSLRAGAGSEREKIIFDKTPTVKQVKESVKKEFEVEVSDDTAGIIRNVLEKFIEGKGKHIAKADLQSVIETVIQDERRPKVLEVLDYHVETFRKKKPFAHVSVSLHGKMLEADGEGVGPVDAAIHAITAAIKKTDTNGFRLTDYNVEIPTTGSDATVEVTMVLADKQGTQVVEKGTSPDIIVASIEAYEKGYNELVWQRAKIKRT